MKNILIVCVCFLALVIGAMFPVIETVNAQFIDRIVRPCSFGATPRAQVIVNPNNSGDVRITTCTGGDVLINGVAIIPGSGTTINATDNVLPKRLNATAFTDSRISDNGTDINAGTSASGAMLNIIPSTVNIGDVNSVVNGTVLSVQDTPQIISITRPLVPLLAGTVTIGTGALPFSSVFVGAAATNNIKLTGTATGARVATFPDLTGTVALTTNNLSIFAATTSAQLRTLLSDENGTGAALFDGSTSATFVTPSLGVATATRLGLGAAADATAVLYTAGALVNFSGSSTLAWDTANLTATQVSGLGAVFGNKPRSANTGVQFGNNVFYDGAFKYVVTDEAAYMQILDGAFNFLTTPSGTAGTAATFTERFSVQNTGNINISGVKFYGNGTPGIAGNGTLNANSDDSAGKITTTATGASTVVLTFSAAFTRAPACTVQNETTGNLVRPVSTTTTLTINATIVSGDSIAYVCLGY